MRLLLCHSRRVAISADVDVDGGEGVDEDEEGILVGAGEVGRKKATH